MSKWSGYIARSVDMEIRREKAEKEKAQKLREAEKRRRDGLKKNENKK